MDFAYTDEQKILRDNIVRFAREVLNPGCRGTRSRPGVLARALAQVRGDRHPGASGAGASTAAAGATP